MVVGLAWLVTPPVFGVALSLICVALYHKTGQKSKIKVLPRHVPDGSPTGRGKVRQALMQANGIARSATLRAGSLAMSQKRHLVPLVHLMSTRKTRKGPGALIHVVPLIHVYSISFLSRLCSLTQIGIRADQSL